MERYLNPKYSRWISTDPALGEYIPCAPTDEEVRRPARSVEADSLRVRRATLPLSHSAQNYSARNFFVLPSQILAADLKMIALTFSQFCANIGAMARRFSAKKYSGMSRR